MIHKAVLHCAIFSATCLGVATQVAEELHGVTCYPCNLFRNIYVARNVAQRLQQLLIAVAQCNTPATCLTMLCSISQSGSLLFSPRSSSVTVLRVAKTSGFQVAVSVTLLFVQLQWYAFKRYETSCTKKLPSNSAFSQTHVYLQSLASSRVCYVWKLVKLVCIFKTSSPRVSAMYRSMPLSAYFLCLWDLDA